MKNLLLAFCLLASTICFAKYDTTRVIFKDARGLDISIPTIKKIALEQSHEFLVLFVMAEEDEHEYIEMVRDVAIEQHHKDKKKICVFFYDKPEEMDASMSFIYYKGMRTLPLTYRSDKYGADLSSLIRRVWYDHYQGQ